MLEPVARFLNWIAGFMPEAPYARLFLWTMIGLAAALIVYLVWERLRTGEWRLWQRRASQAVYAGEEEDEARDFQPKPAWLEEADALAARGLFAEAVHHLLFRSIDDIAYRRPRLVRPALTSREIAGAEAIPPKPRELFARIAALVERSLFGGRPVSVDDWSVARAAYADLAAGQSWRA